MLRRLCDVEVNMCLVGPRWSFIFKVRIIMRSLVRVAERADGTGCALAVLDEPQMEDEYVEDWTGFLVFSLLLRDRLNGVEEAMGTDDD